MMQPPSMQEKSLLNSVYNFLKVSIQCLTPFCFASNSPWPNRAGCPVGTGGSEGATPIGLRALLDNVDNNFVQIANLIGGSAYVGGVAFMVAGILKLKQHRDNPAQVTIATPITYIMIGTMLIFLPSLIQVTRESVFTNTTTTAGRIQGIDEMTMNNSESGTGTIFPSAEQCR